MGCGAYLGDGAGWGERGRADGGGAGALRRGIGYVIQETGLFPHMTVERNAGMALELAGQSRAQREGRVREVLGLAGWTLGSFGEISVAAFGGPAAASWVGSGFGE